MRYRVDLRVNFKIVKDIVIGIEELKMMANKPGKTNTKRLPKGQRTHIRRMKQAARKEASTTSPQSSPAQPTRAQKKQDKS
jgi:hypothetical protein